MPRAGVCRFVLSALSAILAGLVCCAMDRARLGSCRWQATPVVAESEEGERERRSRQHRATSERAGRNAGERKRCARRSVVVARCVRRASRWKLPPNWSRADWRLEAESLAESAAFEAERVFDEAVGAPREAFVYRRTLSALVARFRSEWNQARTALGAAKREPRGWVESHREEGGALLESLRGLSESDGWLLRRLYRDQVTESALARELGISQQAVSKRKRTVIGRLREEIGRGNFTELSGSRL